jgi:hypothetical protein
MAFCVGYFFAATVRDNLPASISGSFEIVFALLLAMVFSKILTVKWSFFLLSAFIFWLVNYAIISFSILVFLGPNT